MRGNTPFLTQSIQLPSPEFIRTLSERTIPLRAEYVISGMKNEDLIPSTVPEFAFVGRSNTGKSSILNFIAGRKNLARVGQTPGRTQTINLFSVEKKTFFLVDLPGYGYAKSSHALKGQWETGIQKYFEERTGLCAVFFLIDIRREPNTEDEYLSKWLQEQGLMVIGVQTKCDKEHKSQWARRRTEQARKLALTPEQMISTSVLQKIGLPELFRMMAGVLETLTLEQEGSSAKTRENS